MDDFSKYIRYCCDQCDFNVKERPEFKTHLDENHNDITGVTDDYSNDVFFNENDSFYTDIISTQDICNDGETVMEEIKFKIEDQFTVRYFAIFIYLFKNYYYRVFWFGMTNINGLKM